ncbi:MAG: hypothetical protein ACYC9U_10280 [Nitrososphaerales archaeon]
MKKFKCPTVTSTDTIGANTKRVTKSAARVVAIFAIFFIPTRVAGFMLT